jgi:hypothetical protein
MVPYDLKSDSPVGKWETSLEVWEYDSQGL